MADSNNLVITIIGILASLILTIFVSLNSEYARIFLHPYMIFGFLFLVLSFSVYLVKKSVDGMKRNLRVVAREQRRFDDKFKIYERLNKLEIEVFDGKKRSA